MSQISRRDVLDGASLAVGAFPLAASAAAGNRDPRIEALIQRMTIEEKVD